MAATPSTISPRHRGRNQAAPGSAAGSAIGSAVGSHSGSGDWLPRVLIRVPHIVEGAEIEILPSASKAAAAGSVAGGSAAAAAAQSIGRYIIPIRRFVTENYLMLSAAAVALLVVIVFFHGRGSREEHALEADAPAWNDAAETPHGEGGEHLMHSAQGSATNGGAANNGAGNGAGQNWSAPALPPTPANVPSANIAPRQDGVVPGRAGDSRGWPTPPMRPDDLRNPPDARSWPAPERGWPAAQNNGSAPPVQPQDSRWSNWPPRDNAEAAQGNPGGEYRTARSSDPAVIRPDRGPMPPGDPNGAHLNGIIERPPQ